MELPKTYQGRPQRTSPAVKVPILGAKKVMKMKPVSATREPSSVFFCPYQSTSQPLSITPKKAPTPEAFPIPDCQGAVRV
jgi:hypothetical protein